MRVRLPTLTGFLVKYLFFIPICTLFICLAISSLVSPHISTALSITIIVLVIVLLPLCVAISDCIRLLPSLRIVKNRLDKMTGILPLDPQMTQSWTFKRSPMFEELDTYGVNGRVSLQAVGQGWAYVDYEFFVYPLEHLKTSTVYYSILEITLPRQLPHIIFDSKQMNGRQMHLSFDAGQKIELEGNFSMFFDTYFPATYHIDLLSIVSPEVMEALIEAKEFDIEIYGSSLRLYGPMQTPAEVQRLMQLGFLIRDKLMNNVVTYSDQRIAIKPREQIHTHGLQIQSNFRLNAVSLFIGSLISFGISCWVLYALFTLPFNLLRYSKITILLIGCSALSIALFVGGISTLKNGRKERQERRNTRPN